MGCKIEVLFTPAEFNALQQRDLAESTCIVFDVLRATSTMVAALAHGARAFIPVEGIQEAMDLRRQQPEALLAGERDGVRISGALTGGTAFDLGNSPREFTPEMVRGRTIIATTTNGTRALRACLGAKTVVIGSFLNLSATVDFVVRHNPRHLLMVGAGTGEGAALEDTLAAGAACDQLAPALAACEFLDSADIAVRLYRQTQANLSEVVRCSQNGRRLLANAELRDDVEFCLRRDGYNITAVMGGSGSVTRWPGGDSVGLTRS